MKNFTKAIDGREKNETLIGAFFKRLCVGVGVVGAVITCWQWISGKNSDPLIDVRVIDKQCLTRSFDEPGLSCDYTFRARKVHNLWAMKIKLENVCNKNIIGVSGGDLMSTDLVFCVGKPMRIIAYELENNQIDGAISVCSNRLHLSFGKWYPEHVCIMRLFCEGEEQVSSPTQLRLGKCGDPLKQGDVRIVDQNDSQGDGSQKRSMLSRLPYCVQLCLEWMVIVIHAIVLISVIGVFCKIPWIKIWQRKKWEKRYGAAFESALARECANETSCDYKKGLDNLSNEFWERVHIPKPRTQIAFYDGNGINRNSLVPFIFVMSILGVAAATVVLALLNV